MRTLQATTVSVGGLTFHTDNDKHPLIDKVLRLLDIWAVVGIQINILLMSVNPALVNVDLVAQRLLAWMDKVEIVGRYVVLTADSFLDSCQVVWELWQGMAIGVSYV
jgi:hypothetical protein